MTSYLHLTQRKIRRRDAWRGKASAEATAAKARKAEQASTKPKLPPTDRPGGLNVR